jgi:hypothetical protein
VNSSIPDVIRTWGAIAVSGILLLVVLIWIIVTAFHVGTVPTYNSKGVLEVDPFANAKDILVILIPFATTVAGFWLGSQGTTAAQKQATEATAQANAANAQAITAKTTLDSIRKLTASSDDQDSDKVSRVQRLLADPPTGGN